MGIQTQKGSSLSPLSSLLPTLSIHMSPINACSAGDCNYDKHSLATDHMMFQARSRTMRFQAQMGSVILKCTGGA